MPELLKNQFGKECGKIVLDCSNVVASVSLPISESKQRDRKINKKGTSIGEQGQEDN